MAEEGAETVDDRLAAMVERIDRLESTFEGHLQDVRDRVIQLKETVDEAAPADHDHERVDDLAAGQETLADRLDDLAETVEALDGRAGAPEENVRETLSTHDRRLDDLASKVDVLASSTMEVQDELDALTGGDAGLADTSGTIGALESEVERLAAALGDVRERLDDDVASPSDREALAALYAAAEADGVSRARCGSCEAAVELAFLQSPSCRHCGARFVDVEAGGFLGSATLETAGAGVDGEDGPAASPDADEATSADAADGAAAGLGTDPGED